MGTSIPSPHGVSLDQTTVIPNKSIGALKPGDAGYEEPTGEPVIEGDFDPTINLRESARSILPNAMIDQEDPPKL